MALSNDPVFAQQPKTAGISLGAGAEETELDPATVTPTTILTAGANGALVTSVVVTGEITQTACKCVLWVDVGGAGTNFIVLTGLMAAYTQATTTAQGKLTMVDKTVPDEAIRLGAGDILGYTHHVDLQQMVFAEYTDF